MFELGIKVINKEMYPSGYYGIVSKVENFDGVTSITITPYSPDGTPMTGQEPSSSEEGLKAVGWEPSLD